MTDPSSDPSGGLRERLAARAAELGFARFGVATVAPLDPEADALRAWLAAGHHGQMRWMADTAEVRADPSDPRMLAGARSVVALATPYGDAPADGLRPGVVARYARGRDYHNVLSKRLRKLTAILREAGFAARASVDSLPVLERAWAQRAGLGFVGKNACLIVPGLGSHVFLSTIVTEATLPPDAPMPARCGDCARCLDACPTAAFLGPRSLDARRCISYLTIEHDGAIDPALREGVGARVFGCDVCQDVCPFNATERPGDPAFARHPRLDEPLEALLALDDDGLRAWGEGSPLRRAGREGLARNAAVALGNVGGRRHLPVLQRAAAEDASPVVREAAAWAASRIASRIASRDP